MELIYKFVTYFNQPTIKTNSDLFKLWKYDIYPDGFF